MFYLLSRPHVFLRYLAPATNCRRCGGLRAPAYSELRVTSPGNSARSNYGLGSLACQALQDDVACCRCGVSLRCPACYTIPHPTAANKFSRPVLLSYECFFDGQPKTLFCSEEGFQKNLLCNSHSSNTLLCDYYFRNTVVDAPLVHHAIYLWTPP